MAELSLSMPAHIRPTEIKLDEELLNSLDESMDNDEGSVWPRWYHAITCFNWANTDDTNFAHQLQWGLLCSAFERLLDASSDAKNVARKFTQHHDCGRPVKSANAQRRANRWKDLDEPLRHQWMREFYRIRGDMAHGRLETRQPFAWKPREHLFLATLAFPLLVRCLLAEKSKYTLSEDDRTHLNMFEQLADCDFFGDHRRLMPQETPWRKLIEEERDRLTSERALEHLARLQKQNNDSSE